MKLWGGRFDKNTSKLMDEFGNSISFDYKLYKQDIKGSIAHAKMLGRIGVLTQIEVDSIIDGLLSIEAEIESGEFEFKISNEDIHMNIEAKLTEMIGDAGKKLHTARSRNDQVALDVRMYLKEEIDLIAGKLMEVIKTLTAISESEIDTILPAYTHLQGAQPVRLSFYLMAYVEMFKRDIGRLKDCHKRTDFLPLGSGALAGVNYEIDRDMVRELLGFDSITINAMDAVSDRDFVVEFISASSIIIMHLSRICEEIIIWCSNEFKFLNIDDEYSTGSSIMPQKKNPDAAELIRGKSGRVFGNLVGILTVLKGLPMAYNKDMQEDKEALFDTVDTIKISLDVFAEMMMTMTFNKENMLKATKNGFLNATDVADYLVGKGMEFRNAHEVTGSIVSSCIEKKISIEEMSLKQLKSFSDKFDDDIYDAIDILSSVESKKSFGSTNKSSVIYSIQESKDFMAKEK